MILWETDWRDPLGAFAPLAGEVHAHLLHGGEQSATAKKNRGSALFITNSLIGLRPAVLMGYEHGGSGSGDIFHRLKSCYARMVQTDVDRRRAAD